jgi:uncharacterized caspase-like protein
MMRCASVCVGIVDYSDPRYRGSEMRLRYAASDAEAFSRYATAISDNAPATSDHHVLLIDRDATAANLNSAFASVAKLEALQLFLLYLSGHGELGHTSGGWFCLADATSGQPSLTGSMLRTLLGQILSEHIVVLIDCCHAEAVATAIGLPADLNDRKGQLIIASARANQRSWEDEDLHRSLFSDVVLRSRL